ncbi:hypothetical protein Plhal304r1_c018g0064091 [Plasmopara halstedii]
METLRSILELDRMNYPDGTAASAEHNDSQYYSTLKHSAISFLFSPVCQDMWLCCW